MPLKWKVLDLKKRAFNTTFQVGIFKFQKQSLKDVLQNSWKALVNWLYFQYMSMLQAYRFTMIELYYIHFLDIFNSLTFKLYGASGFRNTYFSRTPSWLRFLCSIWKFDSWKTWLSSHTSLLQGSQSPGF